MKKKKLKASRLEKVKQSLLTDIICEEILQIMQKLLKLGSELRKVGGPNQYTKTDWISIY
jgi:hypothetical protein